MRICILWLVFLGFAFAQAEPNPRLPARTKVALEGQYNTKQKFAGLLELFLPLYQQERMMLFTDLRFLDREGAPFEGNFGLGFRWVDPCNEWLVGIYSFYDRKRSQYHNFFNQITAGLDVAYRKWWFTVNGYFPFGGNCKPASELHFTKLEPSSINGFFNIFFREGHEIAMTGFDAELGYDFPRGFSLFLGGYYFDHQKTSAIAGPRVRLVHLLNAAYNKGRCTNNNFYVEGIWQHDRVRKSQWIVSLRVEFDVGRKNKYKNYAINRRLTRYLQRDVDVIVSFDNKSPFRRLNKANMQPVEVKIATQASDLAPGILNVADVIAIHGDIGTDAFALPSDKTLTGRDYFFGDDFSIRLSEGGSLTQTGAASTPFINLMGQNYIVRDLTLTMLPTNLPAVLANSANQSVGNVCIDNLTANSGVNFAVFSGTGSNISLINSHFNHMIAESIISFETKTEISVPQFCNNEIQFGGSVILSGIIFANDFAPNAKIVVGDVCNNKLVFPSQSPQTAGITFVNFIDGAGNAELSVDNVANNSIQFPTMSSGLLGIIFANTNSGSQVSMHVNHVENNLINIIGNGNQHVGIEVSNFSDNGGQTSTVIERFIGNQINVSGSGSGHVGLRINGENKKAASPEIQLTIGNNGGLKNNQFTSNQGSLIPIQIMNQEITNNTSKITIDVQDFGNSLGDANGGVTPQISGPNIHINP